MKKFICFLSILSAFLFYPLLASEDYHGQNISSYVFTDSQYDSDDFTNSDFSQVTADGTTFSSLSVKRNFSGSNFTQASLRDALFNYADLTNANFSSADLHDAYLMSATLYGADFSNAIIDYADFTNTVQNGFTAQQLYSTQSYQQKNLPYVDFTDNIMTEWNFAGQNLTRDNFSVAGLQNADFRDANLTNAIFNFTQASGADFRGSTGANFNSSSLSNTILADGSVYGGAITLSAAQDSLIIRTSSSSAVKVSADSAVSDGATLVFKDKISNADNASILVSGDGVVLDLSGAHLNVYLAQDAAFSESVTLALIQTSNGAALTTDGLSKDTVSLFNYDGSVYSGIWDLVADSSSVGVYIAIPEPAATAALLMAAALLGIHYCRRRV